VRCRAAGVYDALWDSFVVEMGDLLAQMKVLHQRRATLAGLQRVIRVRQPETL
jgi:hypothetical protein